MYIPSLKLISQSMLKKSPENPDGRTDRRTDGRTLPRHNTSRFSNGRIKMTSLTEHTIPSIKERMFLINITPNNKTTSMYFHVITLQFYWTIVWEGITMRCHIHMGVVKLSTTSNCIYSISQEICTRFCCALFCCGYAIVHNEFTWSIYPYSSGLLCWHWGNR